MVNRYKLTWTEWVSTHNPKYPLQKEIKSSETSFKTRTQAEEFFEEFKDTVKEMKLIDTVTGKVIRQ